VERLGQEDRNRFLTEGEDARGGPIQGERFAGELDGLRRSTLPEQDLGEQREAHRAE
jgi:hypothetical protein